MLFKRPTKLFCSFIFLTSIFVNVLLLWWCYHQYFLLPTYRSLLSLWQHIFRRFVTWAHMKAQQVTTYFLFFSVLDNLLYHNSHASTYSSSIIYFTTLSSDQMRFFYFIFENAPHLLWLKLYCSRIIETSTDLSCGFMGMLSGPAMGPIFWHWPYHYVCRLQVNYLLSYFFSSNLIGFSL